MKTRLVLTVALTLMTLLGAVIPAAAGAPLMMDTVHLNVYGAALACSGEFVALSGQVTYVFQVQSDAQGYHWQSHSELSMGGVGLTSGAHYQYQMVSTELSAGDLDSFPATYTAVARIQTIGQGPDNHYVAYWRFHVTNNADGTQTVNIADWGYECS